MSQSDNQNLLQSRLCLYEIQVNLWVVFEVIYQQENVEFTYTLFVNG